VNQVSVLRFHFAAGCLNGNQWNQPTRREMFQLPRVSSCYF